MMNECAELCEKLMKNKERDIYLKKLSKYLLGDPSRAQNVWSYGTIPLVLLDEIMKSYLVFEKKDMLEEECSKVSMLLNILQTMVEDDFVRKGFIYAEFPIFILPFLNSRKFTPELESLRLAALGVMGTLVKDGDISTINYLKDTDIVPLTLKTMDSGSEISKAISAYIFLKIIQTKEGLESLTTRYEKFMLICDVLNSMISNSIKISSKRVLMPALQCLKRLLEVEDVKEALRTETPKALADPQIDELLKNEKEMTAVYNEILLILK